VEVIKEFKLFYENYLGLKDKKYTNGIAVSLCPQRDVPLNKRFFYKLIASGYDGEIAMSCSQDFSEEEIIGICRYLASGGIDESLMQSGIKVRNYDQSFMYRMIQHVPSTFDVNDVICLPGGQVIKVLYVENSKKFLAIMDDSLVGYSKVSDVIYGYGNIVVWIEEAFRRMGIAERLVKLLINRCYEDDIVPMYIAREDNVASIELAKKLHFEIVQKEFVASYVAPMNPSYAK